MEKAVLISIQPSWCELIETLKKKADIRKTKPSLELPFRCYIYCTQGFKFNTPYSYKTWAGRGKVIGEFVCDKIEHWKHHWMPDVMHIEDMSSLSCVPVEDLLAYLGQTVDRNGFEKVLYAWHISDLVIYDKPKELSEFSKYGFGHPAPLKRPPQSWCYVEVLKCV